MKPGQELTFESYITKLVAAADKAGAKMTWTTYVVSPGKPGATYRVALSFNSWADRDGWTTIPAMVTKAFGQQEAERLIKEGGSATERSVSEVWETLPNLSANTAHPERRLPTSCECKSPACNPPCQVATRR